MGTILVGSIVVIICAAAVWKLHKDKKNGSGCSGCSGCSGSCQACHDGYSEKKE